MPSEKEITDNFLSKIRSVEIPMTLECNFRCAYCYIRDNKYKEQKIITDQVIKLFEPIKNYFPSMLKKDIPCFIIPWGSEPLMNWNVIEEAMEYLFTTYPDVPITTSWSTNASIINDKYINFIKKYYDRVTNIQISLDGPQEVQDYSRKIMGKQGSFFKVMSHIQWLTQEIPDIKRKLMFKSTVSPEQIKLGHIYKACVFFWEEMGFDGSPVSFTHDSWYDDEAIKAFADDMEKIKNYCQQHPDKHCGLFNFIERDANCSAGLTQLGVNIDGNVYYCHTAYTDDEKQKLFRLGNVLTGEVDTKAIYRITFAKYNYNELKRPMCQNCIVYKINPLACWSCPMDMHNFNKFSYTTNLSVCSLYRIIAKHYEEWGKHGQKQSN